jgi:hypothetical protein
MIKILPDTPDIYGSLAPQRGGTDSLMMQREIKKLRSKWEGPNVQIHVDVVCDLPKTLPAIELHHGAALWVLTRLGFRGPVPETTFNEYIKSLRKLGTPFERGSFERRGLANYSYFHLMELALALNMRVYHVVPDSVLVQIVRSRKTLYRHYERAYSERLTKLGSPISIVAKGEKPMGLRGAFLDLQIDFSGGRLAKFGPPKLISPFEALTIFADTDLAARSFLPINLSVLSERLVSAALEAPLIRRGPRPSV